MPRTDDRDPPSVCRLKTSAVQEEGRPLMDRPKLLRVLGVQERDETHALGGPRVNRGGRRSHPLVKRVIGFGCEQVALSACQSLTQHGRCAADLINGIGDLCPTALQVAQEGKQCCLLQSAVHRGQASATTSEVGPETHGPSLSAWCDK